jgi:FAD:protein FMN transferase
VSDAYEHTTAAMGTVVSVRVAGGVPAERAQRVQRALAWFAQVESVCSRFDADSEVRRLCTHVGTPVPVSALLFEVLQFALAVAAASDGAFDPTLGALGEARGFDRHWRTGLRTNAPREMRATRDERRTYGWRTVELDARQHTVMLREPLLLDLGAVAKGLAIDLAARELADCEDFAIDAGGDLYLGGSNSTGEPWSVGLRNPSSPHTVFARLRVRNQSVCTSGDYARASSDSVSTHLIDPASVDAAAGDAATVDAASRAISATVVAPQAMVADALATAAYILGPTRGIALLEQQGVQGLIVSADATHVVTRGMSAWLDHPATHAA